MRSLASLALLVAAVGGSLADDASTNDVVNLSSDQIARLRGFEAENHYVATDDGYIINVVYIAPVVKTNKRPVIFNHGTTQSSTYFMTNSVNARPKDYSNISAGSMEADELNRMLANDPVSTCLPLLLACSGYPVWLVNRRGTEFSQTRVNGSRSLLGNPFSSMGDTLLAGLSARLIDSNLTSLLGSSDPGIASLLRMLLTPQLNLASIPNTFDSTYWDFSLDEQAKYDLPAVISYVLERTDSQKVAYVGHSLGNALMFMLQSEQPQWADKVEPLLAWSPDLYLAHTTSILRPLLVALQPILTVARIPFPPTPILPLTRTLLALLCQTKVAQDSICLLLEQSQFGYSDKQLRTLPAFVASQFYSVSSHEAAQLAQNTERGKMYKFQYANPATNLQKYGSLSSPIYNVSRIRSRSISFWRGEKDILASPSDVDILKSDLSVPVDDRLITSVPFAHYDLLFGRDVATLVNLPSLKLIESYN